MVAEEEEEEEEARAFRPASATAVRVRLCAAAVRPVIKSLAQTARGKRRRAVLSIDFALPASLFSLHHHHYPPAPHTHTTRPAPRRSPGSGQAWRKAVLYIVAGRAGCSSRHNSQQLAKDTLSERA